MHLNLDEHGEGVRTQLFDLFAVLVGGAIAFRSFYVKSMVAMFCKYPRLDSLGIGFSLLLRINLGLEFGLKLPPSIRAFSSTTHYLIAWLQTFLNSFAGLGMNAIGS